jgi:hypothetical protein
VLTVVLGVADTNIGVFCEIRTKYLELVTALNGHSPFPKLFDSDLGTERSRKGDSPEVPPEILSNTEITERKVNIQEHEVTFIYYTEIMINSQHLPRSVTLPTTAYFPAYFPSFLLSSIAILFTGTLK